MEFRHAKTLISLDVLVKLKMHQNPFSTRWGSLWRSPRHPSRLERGTLLPIPSKPSASQSRLVSPFSSNINLCLRYCAHLQLAAHVQQSPRGGGCHDRRNTLKDQKKILACHRVCLLSDSYFGECFTRNFIAEPCRQTTTVTILM